MDTLSKVVSMQITILPPSEQGSTHKGRLVYLHEHMLSFSVPQFQWASSCRDTNMKSQILKYVPDVKPSAETWRNAIDLEIEFFSYSRLLCIML